MRKLPTLAACILQVQGFILMHILFSYAYIRECIVSLLRPKACEMSQLSSNAMQSRVD
ncbi:uncharacterized protein CANTADRAFT_27335 [Suhomyces tanzawaensis NRRL Y-17324]|uniref:Uncharacterized protein n=1 Tax=Suhomyces tanzawaensis NRRL Y-17324 TaxID=984487 RepID=A0A1E4SDK5_9ASCO|nr:uncharacterized protein CANTADRAFT_27335 [Suhomyces tanzawaensis NRRL Y-17324]ODV77594.1 hypothetical protein CANTADRAFT_27335 [Suhomyces tanzawaensis NRRL Y-17324]